MSCYERVNVKCHLVLYVVEVELKVIILQTVDYNQTFILFSEWNEEVQAEYLQYLIDAMFRETFPVQQVIKGFLQ